MLTTLKVNSFAAVPYLESSELIRSNPEGLVFSDTKPNVIVGSNGSGKSALMKSLALLTLSYFGGISALDRNYLGSISKEGYWAKTQEWGYDYTFLKGLATDYDDAPALYYEPNHMFGDWSDVTSAMMAGYSEEAREFAIKTRNKSSGQKSKTIQEGFLTALQGDVTHICYGMMNWHHGRKPCEIKDKGRAHYQDVQAEILKARVNAVADTARPMLLMDEPEQSLDTKAELTLWRLIQNADMGKLQVVVATHSLYPLLHPGDFHIIEATPGYVDEVLSLLQ